MEESRPGVGIMSDLIINKPGLMTLRQRFSDSLLTFLFWVFWIYLWLPVISLIAWGAGINLFYQEMIVQRGYEAFFDLLGWYGMVILSNSIVLLSWAGYNLLRFRGKERRRRAGTVRRADVARQFSVEVDQLTRWHGANRMTIYHNKEGMISRVDIAERGLQRKGNQV